MVGAESHQGDILIVDDTVNNLKLLSDMLTASGYRVRKAVSGAIALMAVRSKAPDLILLDINMPDMDGYEVCRRLKANPITAPIPVVFLSALDASFDKVKAFDLGGADYITKPFQQDEVLRRIQNQLRIYFLTQQLEAKNRSLENALAYLKDSQAETLQKGRMAALSQLMGGIAHELNNPVGFIASNLNHAQAYFEQLQGAVIAYRHQFPQTTPEGVDLGDLDFIATDFPKLLGSMQSGTARICTIVQALQTFSHHQEEGIKPTQCLLSLDSVLLLLTSRLQGKGNRPGIVVTKTYGTLPPIQGNGQALGQVFLHLLSNAIDAIEERWELAQCSSDPSSLLQNWEPRITLEARCLEGDRVEIVIGDTGIGIPVEIQSRIYDPFFSTKPVGRGHGLGLSLSYQIITQTHQGELSFHSTPLQGTEFRVTLPVGGGEGDPALGMPSTRA